MNTEADTLLRSRSEEEQHAGGLDAFRRGALQHLKLKTVIKESHYSPIRQLIYNLTCKQAANLFVTIGKDQATVYDDRHIGDYISLVAQYENKGTLYNTGGDLKMCAWLYQDPGEVCEDHKLAVAGEGPIVSIISLAAATVVAQLPGVQTKQIVDLCSCPAYPRMLMSLSDNGQICFWDVPSEECVGTFTCPEAFNMSLHPDGHCLLTSGKGSKAQLKEWYLPLSQTQTGLKLTGDPSCVKCILPGEQPTSSISSMQFVPGNRLILSSVGGMMCSWQWGSTRQFLARWRVPGRDKDGNTPSHSLRCLFRTTEDGDLVCTGNHHSHVYVYETNTGQQLHQLAVSRVSGSVLSCALSNDCRHLLVALGNGFVFRFEHMPPTAERTAPAPGATGVEGEAAGAAAIPVAAAVKGEWGQRMDGAHEGEAMGSEGSDEFLDSVDDEEEDQTKKRNVRQRSNRAQSNEADQHGN